MTNKPRFVFDTSTVVSAVLFEQAKPSQALRRALKLGHVLSSLPTLTELAEVLDREKFDRYVTQEEREEFLEGFIDRTLEIEPVEEIQACRDPKDDKFLELAVAGEARCIVSSDNDLVEMQTFRGIPIMTPAAFLDATESEVDAEEK